MNFIGNSCYSRLLKNRFLICRTMLDINLFRVDKGGNPELIRESQRKRGSRVELVDEIIALDKSWVSARFESDQLNKSINSLQKQLGALMKQKKKEEAQKFIEEKNLMTKKKTELAELAKNLEDELHKKLILVGNMVHSSVPVSMDEANNKVERKWWPESRSEDAELAKRKEMGDKSNKGVPGYYSHHEVLERLNGYDPVRGSNIAGHRGYFLVDVGVELNLALINYGLQFLGERGYTKLWTPFFMNKEMMAKTAQLEQFDEELYKVVEREDTEDDKTKYLIATSEQPISCFHANEWFNDPENQLPLKYAGLSTCFRKEAGAYGKDNWGIFRVHQFEKVEQFILTEPEKSWEMHEKMVAVAEEFYKSLGLPFRVINIVSGALNNAASKKYDLEAWFPFQGEYKELVSCSNCTDYQSRRLEIRCGMKKMNDTAKKYVHALNGTLCATERTICCILENYQSPDGTGFIVPPCLRPWMGNKEFIPFTTSTDKKFQPKASTMNLETLSDKVDGLKV